MMIRGLLTKLTVPRWQPRLNGDSGKDEADNFMLFMLCRIAILRQDTRPPLRQISTWWLETTMQMEATLMRSAFWCISQLSWVKSSCGRAARFNHWKANHSNQHAALSSFRLYFDCLVIYVILICVFFLNLGGNCNDQMSMAQKFSWPAGYRVDKYHEQHSQLHLADGDLGKGSPGWPEVLARRLWQFP